MAVVDVYFVLHFMHTSHEAVMHVHVPSFLYTIQDPKLRAIYETISAHWPPKKRASRSSIDEDEAEEEEACQDQADGESQETQSSETSSAALPDDLLDDGYGDVKSEELRVAQELGCVSGVPAEVVGSPCLKSGLTDDFQEKLNLKSPECKTGSVKGEPSQSRRPCIEIEDTPVKDSSRASEAPFPEDKAFRNVPHDDPRLVRLRELWPPANQI